MKTLISKVQISFSWWKKTDKPGRIDLLLMIILLMVTTLFFLYGDVLATIEHSFNFLDSVFSGKFLDFYQVAIDHSSFGHPAVYEFPIYIVFAIWNLPIYLINKAMPFDYLNSFPCLLWSKLMIVFFVLLAVKVLIKIGEELNISKEHCKWVAFFFLTASTVIIPAFMLVQYDIISIVFMLLGIYCYMKNNLKGFILWFLLANTFKLFAIFIFIPLILLKEKRLIRICLYTLAGLSGIFLCKILYHSNAAYLASTKKFSSTMLDRLQTTTTSLQWQYDGFVLPLFLVLIIGICIFCYWKKCENSELQNRFAIYIPLVVFLGFVALVPFNPYWMILVAPYMVLMPFITPKHLKLNILLETLTGAVLVWLSVMINYPVFGRNIFDRMLLPKIISSTSLPRYNYLRELFIDLGVGDFINIAAALLIACTIAIIFINYPRSFSIEQGVNHEVLERGVVWVRGAVPCIFAGLLMLCYFLSDSGLVYTSVDNSDQMSSKDLLSTGTDVTEFWKFDQDIEIKKIDIGFAFQEFPWIDSSIVNVSLKDSGSQTTIWEESQPVNLFEDAFVSFDTGIIHLKRNTEYELTITGENGEDLPLSVNYSASCDKFPTYENGVLVDGDVALNIYGVWEK